MSQSLDTPVMKQLEIRKGEDAELALGGLRLVACRREVDVFDGGITLIIWSDAPGSESKELLRFDLFRERPHYHAPAEKQEESAIDAAADGCVAWMVAAITQRMPALLCEAGFEDLAAQVDTEALKGSGEKVESLLNSLEEPSQLSHFEIPLSVYESLSQ